MAEQARIKDAPRYRGSKIAEISIKSSFVQQARDSRNAMGISTENILFILHNKLNIIIEKNFP